jgi:integrase
MRLARVPSYRCYKPKNLGLVVINGKQIYLGAYGTPESLAEYNRVVQEFLVDGPALSAPPTRESAPTINTMIVAYWAHAESHYRNPDGSPGGELENMRYALRTFRRLYGHTIARDFGPAGLRAVREALVEEGLGRTTINARINRIRRAFKWAASVELIPVAVVQALATVAGLQKGRTTARETQAVGPVSLDHVEKTLPFLPRPVAALVRLQLLTGMRPGETCSMRGKDLTPGEPNWTFQPDSHKSAWRGRERTIILGPKAVALVQEFLRSDLDEYLFSPADAVAEHHARRRAARKSRPTPGELARRAKDPGAGHAGRYLRKTYLNAIESACKKAGVPGWSPNQLRHTVATAIRAKYGLEAAQAVLGHARADVTQVYAERDLARAHAVLAEIG